MCDPRTTEFWLPLGLGSHRFWRCTNADLFPAFGNLRKVVDIPTNKHLFYGHLLDLMQTSFNRSYLSNWTTHDSSLLPGQNFAPR